MSGGERSYGLRLESTELIRRILLKFRVKTSFRRFLVCSTLTRLLDP